ncbi:MAG: hypothetical protein KHZ15_03960 [Coprobacillus cateniformis]|uniref:hypothetical protein n=1 Tax=Longibaculum muris TaxID=1796628 RepID=UPI003AB11061|nr:hypothetical protein [Coprobacillus cateniformis]
MDKYLIGTKKQGCLIDNKNKIITYYEMLSLAEKLSGKQNKHTILFQDIEKIKISYNIVNGVRYGTTSLILIIYCMNNQKYEVPILYFNTTKEEVKQFLNILNDSSLCIQDQFSLIDKIMNSSKTIGVIIGELDQSLKA